MYDLHAHILPGVDDGPATVREAVEMAHVAARHGTKTILCTPHRKDVTENFSVRHVEDLMASLKTEIDSNDINLELALGMENHLDLDLPKDINSGLALRMNGSRYALVELPFYGYPIYVEDVLFQLQLQGVTPVLAHPERIEAFQRDVDLLARFVERGMLSQITAGSIVGHFGGKARKFTRSLLRRGLVHVIASDTHHPKGHRSPELPAGIGAAARIVGESKAQAMAETIPRSILDDLPVEIDPPSAEGHPRRWWGLWQS